MSQQPLSEIIPVLQGIEGDAKWQFQCPNGIDWIDGEDRSQIEALFWAHATEIRLTPSLWQLLAPPAGKEWAVTDGWNENWLRNGWRPLLKGETYHGIDCATWSTIHISTSRPLPVDPPPPVWLDLEAEDVPLGSFLRGPGIYGAGTPILGFQVHGIHCSGLAISYDRLRKSRGNQGNCYEILRPGRDPVTGWEKWEKEAKPQPEEAR